VLTLGDRNRDEGTPQENTLPGAPPRTAGPPPWRAHERGTALEPGAPGALLLIAFVACHELIEVGQGGVPVRYATSAVYL